ncbi:MAG: hypothetical protein KBT48_11290 [Firmicutes bacterium]|nr:hypothetical protein [Bacillota bacterium]
MKTLVDELNSIQAKKHIVTSVEYDCKNEEKENEVFDTVNDLVINHIDEMAKITYDIMPGHKVKVEVIQNK